MKHSHGRGAPISPVVSRMIKGRVVMGLVFFPRGGSAQATRYLAAALSDAGWSVSLVAGSLGSPGKDTHAPTFFAGIDVHYLDYTAAVDAFEAGASATAAPVPMHASYEDRQDAPDVVLAAVDPQLAEHLSSVWEPPFLAAGAADVDVFHLHHLTPQHDAVARRWPRVPVVAHLHGTEIKLIEAIEERAGVAKAVGTTLGAMPELVRDTAWVPAPLDERQRDLLRTTRWDHWRHGDFWLARLREQARRADHLVVVSPSDRARAIDVFGLAPERVSDIPNGVDTARFRPRALTAAERRAHVRRWLVEDPQGWDERGEPGSVSYRESGLDRLLGPDGEATVFIYVGRFTAAKRVPLLVRAFARARARFERPASLLVWGGHPGEWEDDHPVTVADEVGADGIFFVGWRGHSDLPDGLAICDALVMPSVDDSYPQAPLEAMAVGLPVIATRSGGFPSMINLDPAHPTGWLVPPDDVYALADTLVEAVNRPDELEHRGDAALAYARVELAWSQRVVGFEHAYELARERRATVGSA
jgi:glycosyltransferase involved in cell wall biosynthesis